ncbi:MAG: hypothetical protein ABIQ57_00910 [Candidatus Kapaibacterium sp.]
MKSVNGILILIVLTMIAACGGNPTSPSADEYNGRNGLVINGPEYPAVKVECELASFQILDVQPVLFGVVMQGWTMDDKDIQLRVVLPKNASGPGKYSWVPLSSGKLADDTRGRLGDASVTLEHDGVTYTSTSGTTVITEFPPIGSEMVGRFTGTLINPEGTHTLTVSGKFHAMRLE